MHFHVGNMLYVIFGNPIYENEKIHSILCSTFYLSLQTQATMINDYLEQKQKKYLGIKKNVYKIKLNPVAIILSAKNK